MSPLFDALRERLLAAGVKPSRVRRYLAELADHYEDLLAEEEESGKQGGIARAAALARLGSADDLAEAMMSQSRFRSLAARAPWALFPGGAALGLAAGYGLTTLLMLGAVKSFSLPVGAHLMPPAWLPPIADAVFGFDRYLLPVLLGWLMMAVALRQRLPARWPVAAMGCLSLLGAGLYCCADWPSEPTVWSFHVGSLLDGQAQSSPAAYAMHASVSFLAGLLPYLALRRRLRASLAGLAVTGLLAGCSSTPPTAEELIHRFAENRANGEFTMQAATSEDAAAMDHAADELRVHLAAPPPPAVKPDHFDGVMEVAVTASHDLAGNWRMISPTQFQVRSGAPDAWGHVREFLCRFEQDGDELSGSCLPQRRGIRGTLRGDELHFGWGAGLITANVDGRLLSPTDFAGEVSVGTLGVKLIKTDAPAYGNKIATLPPPPDGADSEAGIRFAGLAGMKGYSYLGSVEMAEGGTMLVYDVEYEKRWELCGFTVGKDGLECR